MDQRISKKEQVEFVRRDTKEKRLVECVKLVEVTNSLLGEIQESMLAKATEFLHENTFEPTDFQDFKSISPGQGRISSRWLVWARTM